MNAVQPLTNAMHVPLVTVQPRLPDERYIMLHGKCAAGKATRAENAELGAWCDRLEREFTEGPGTAQQAAPASHDEGDAL